MEDILNKERSSDMKEFEIEVSKTVHDNFIAETEDEAVDMAVQKFDDESADIYVLDEIDLGDKPVIKEFNEDSLNKLTDKELDNLKVTIDIIKGARLNKARKEAIQTFKEAAKRLFDLNLTITAFDPCGDSVEVYNLQNLEIE